MPRLLPTTIAGSLPKPSWLAPPNTLWAPWKLEGDDLAEGKRDAVRLVLRDQERAGIDIVTDGEQTRRHFVTTFIEALDGVDFANRRTVRIRNRYDADVPVVTGPVARRRQVFVDDAAFLRSATDRRVKFTLPGPMTMVDTLFDAHYRSREKLAFAFAEILNAEAREIAATGVDVIQFDEPAFNVYFDEVRDWGVAALERAALGPAVHDRRPHLLWLRHRGEHPVEEDAGQRMAAVRADVPAARPLDDPAGLAGVREFARSDRPHRAPRRQGRPRRRDRRRQRPGGDARGRRGDDPRSAAPCPGGAPVSLHQLRDGAAVARDRTPQARLAGRRGGAGAGRTRRRLKPASPRPPPPRNRAWAPCRAVVRRAGERRQSSAAPGGSREHRQP